MVKLKITPPENLLEEKTLRPLFILLLYNSTKFDHWAFKSTAMRWSNFKKRETEGQLEHAKSKEHCQNNHYPENKFHRHPGPERPDALAHCSTYGHRQ